MSERKRQPLSVGSVITVNGISIQIVGYAGQDQGSTCLAYYGRILENDRIAPGMLVVVKEFYPKARHSVFDITREEDGRLRVSELTKKSSEYREKRSQFEAGCRMQKELANSSTMEIMVKPYLWGNYGDSMYLVSDIHQGKSLDQVHFGTLEERLACAVRVTELMGILHEAGYMMSDFKPENLLWTEHPRAVKLIDADSVFPYGCPEKDSETAEEEMFFSNSKYSSPQIERLKKMVMEGKCLFSEKRDTYLRPQANVYSLGIYIFELLFGRIPGENDGKSVRGMSEELGKIYKKEGISRKAAESLSAVLARAMDERPGRRYADGYRMMDALNECVKYVSARKYVPKKANYTYLSYSLLEQFPLYEYSHTKNGIRSLDAAIAGTHSMREHLLKVMISCAQMTDSVLNIYLFSEDAEAFWNEFISEGKNPELRRTVKWSIDGRPSDNDELIRRAEIVDSPLAFVHLYTDACMENIMQVLKQKKIRYILLADREEEDGCRNEKAAEKVLKNLSGKKAFIGYLSDTGDRTIREENKVTLFPVSTEKISSDYNEDIYKSRIFKMGLQVHEYYYRGGNPRATAGEIRKDYESDAYYIESSQRSALHAKYKLASAGIDPGSPEAPYQFYREVLDSENEQAAGNFDRLAALEHRSWTAWMVLTGAKGIDTKEEMEKYFFDGENDWRDRRNPAHIKHPCLKASLAGRRLTATWWKNRRRHSKTKLEQLDPLDRRSLEIYMAAEDVAGRRRSMIDRCIEDMEHYYISGADNNEAQDALEKLRQAVNKCYARETSCRRLWEAAVREFTEICADEGLLTQELRGRLDTLGHLMKPVLWVTDYHDFKKADEDVLRALPRILLLGMKKEGTAEKVTIVKPMAGNTWQNIFSSIMIDPDQLVLVPMNGEDKEEVEQIYRNMTERCRLGTEVMVRSVKELRRYGGRIFIDETGSTPVQSRCITGKTCMKDAHTFEVRERMLRSTDDNPVIELYNRPVNLTVNETLMLHGAEVVSETMPDYVVGLKESEYRSIWNLYRELNEGKKWHLFLAALRELEAGKVKKASLEVKAQPAVYETDCYIEESALRQTGLDRVLAELCSRKIIAKYKVPERGGYARVSISTAYPEVADVIGSLTGEAAEEPARHSYHIQTDEKEVKITDDSLYISGTFKEKADRGDGQESDSPKTAFLQAAEILDKRNKDKILQNVRILNGKGSIPDAVSFRYASEPVKEVLKNYGSILEAVIFHECRAWKIFDDIRVNVRFMWPGDRTANELDVVGTKNSRTYFISAKMKDPDKMDAYEVDNLCQRFAIEGHAILVSSFPGRGGKEDVDHAALRDRISDMKTISYIGAEKVDCEGADGRRNLLVAESISEIVNQK